MGSVLEILTVPVPKMRAWIVAAIASVLVAAGFGWFTVALRANPPANPQSNALQQPPEFQKDILPIFQKNCVRCHGATTRQSGLDLSTLEGVSAGSLNGDVIVAKQPDKSKLYQMVRDAIMPFDRKTQVTPAESATIR